MSFKHLKKVIGTAAICCVSLLPNITLATSDLPSVNVSRETKKLPRQDIQRFVTAIAVIHHYYIKKVTNQRLFNQAIQGMVSSLDPHSMYLDPASLKELKTTVSGKFVGVGIELTVKNGLLKVISPLEGSPAQKAGVKANDIIMKIDDTFVRKISLNEAVKRIKGKKGTTVILTVIRKGDEKPITIPITRNVIKLVSVKEKMLQKGYGYVRITFFQGPVAAQLHRALEHLKEESDGKLSGLILDLRSNPGGLLDVSGDVANEFLNSKKLHGKYNDYIVYTKGRIPGSDIHIKATPGDFIEGTPMVVMINGGSASASEIVAGALQDYKRAVIVGTRSFGKGSVQTVLPIGKDSAIKLTTALYYTPAGRVIQAKGIIPDITVPQLTVKTPKGNMFSADESDFKNHLLNGKKTEAQKEKVQQRKEMLASQMKLAKDDYQLYEAFLILKSLSATNVH